MDELTISLPVDMSLKQIGARWTIGGEAYAQAIANYNNIDTSVYGLDDQLPAGATIKLPMSWLGPVYQPVSTPATNGKMPASGWLWIAGALAAGFLMREGVA